MKKLLLGALLLLIIISCSDKNKTENQIKAPIIEKTAIELEDESMAKGIVMDSTLLNFVFGMTKDQVLAHCKKLRKENNIGDLTDGNVYYAIETKSFKKVAMELEFYYDNENKLFRITEQPVMLDRIEKKEKSNSSANVVDEIWGNYKNDLGKKPLTNGTQSNAKFYWLKGDKRFDYLEKNNTCVLARSKISAERKMMKVIEELEREKLEEDRRKKEEEILQKEILANLQIQEEQNIIEKLKRKASNNWPDDYTTQEYWINEQIEAYHYMLTIPNNDRIKKKAQNNWPLDFSTQQYWYNEQVEAKERLR